MLSKTINSNRNLLVFLIALSIKVMPTPALAQVSPQADAAKILQQTLDIKELQQYFHVGTQPERSRLFLVSHSHLDFTGVSKFGKLVAPVYDNNKNGQAHTNYVRVERIQLQNSNASIKLTYPREGVAVQAQLSRNKKGDWSVIQYKLYER